MDILKPSKIQEFDRTNSKYPIRKGAIQATRWRGKATQHSLVYMYLQKIK